MPAADPEFAFDILRGAAAFTGDPVIADLARAVAAHPEADLSIAFNHKQIASKRWLCDSLYASLGGIFSEVTILGGWYGILAAMLASDRRFAIRRITSIDIDPSCAPVAMTLNRRGAEAGAFEAVTADMLALKHEAQPDGLIINTSCEHLEDFPGWIGSIPAGARLVLQSNDYFREPDHRSCFKSLEDFRAAAALRHAAFSGSSPAKNYTRFMLIGAR